MGIFGQLFSPITEAAGSAVGGLAGSIFGNKGKEIGSDVGKIGGRLIGGIIPFANGGAVMVMPKKRKTTKKGSTAMKRKMAKVRAAKRM